MLLVKGAQAWQHNRILACIDATSPDDGHQLINDNILTFAEQLSDHFDTDLHLVNAYPMVNVAFAMVPEVTAPDDLHSYIEQQHRDACAKWARKYNVNPEQMHVQEGDPENVVSEMAKSLEADLVVIGSVGRTGISSVLIGNTAELLMDKVACDVLVIKPEQGVGTSIKEGAPRLLLTLYENTACYCPRPSENTQKLLNACRAGFALAQCEHTQLCVQSPFDTKPSTLFKPMPCCFLRLKTWPIWWRLKDCFDRCYYPA